MLPTVEVQDPQILNNWQRAAAGHEALEVTLQPAAALPPHRLAVPGPTTTTTRAALSVFDEKGMTVNKPCRISLCYYCMTRFLASASHTGPATHRLPVSTCAKAGGLCVVVEKHTLLCAPAFCHRCLRCELGIAEDKRTPLLPDAR